MKRIARRDSPPHKRYRRDPGSNGRDSSSYRGYGNVGNRSRPMQPSPVYERRNPRPGSSSFSRSPREYGDSGRQTGSGSYHSGPPIRRFPHRSSGSRRNCSPFIWQALLFDGRKSNEISNCLTFCSSSENLASVQTLIVFHNGNLSEHLKTR
ncbi:hypothetical protein EGR_03777 [Echinococcus granulosus]|uniref:Uncharacterized protein n=1 Tax=Echinococcus granulosus TaxID=6210 RepID=W6UJH5_ECHGR|nr:hypothetical protein EGR_03777 [Echinococcus granulosus]EUB61291.1 hypothetical protein EGR_03777 [Echinococcus granulosus]